MGQIGLFAFTVNAVVGRRKHRVRCSATNSPSSTSDRYAARGVSAAKEDVHTAIRNVDKGLFPQAFCKIVPDYLGALNQ